MESTKNLKNNKQQKLKKSSKNRKLKIIKKILVPLDGSKQSFHALDMAISISSHYSSSITGIYVFDLPISLKFAVIDPVGEKLKKKILDVMQKATLRCNDQKISFKSILINGNAGQDIIQQAKKGKFDLIIMGKKSISSTSEVFLGSISHYVIHHSKIPVFIVK